jgi:hypothetical protein
MSNRNHQLHHSLLNIPRPNGVIRAGLFIIPILRIQKKILNIEQKAPTSSFPVQYSLFVILLPYPKMVSPQNGIVFNVSLMQFYTILTNEGINLVLYE